MQVNASKYKQLQPNTRQCKQIQVNANKYKQMLANWRNATKYKHIQANTNMPANIAKSEQRKQIANASKC